MCKKGFRFRGKDRQGGEVREASEEEESRQSRRVTDETTPFGNFVILDLYLFFFRCRLSPLLIFVYFGLV